MKKKQCFVKSMICAIRGLFLALWRERNFRIYTLMVLATVPLNIWLQLSGTRILLLFLCVCGAFSAECLNTAIEQLCDKISEDYCERIRYIKDVAAAAVLWWGIGYAGVELFTVGEKLFGSL